MDKAISYSSRKYAYSLFLSGLLEKSLFEALQRHLDVRKGEKVLEVGCNRGAMVKRIQNLGADAYGVDVNNEAIQEGVTLNLRIMNATNLEYPEATFDKVFSFHTIEHIADVTKALSEMDRVLKPGGKLLLTYPIEPGFLRGFSCVHHAITVYKNPFYARKMHIHSLDPRKIKELTKRSDLLYIKTSIFDIPLYPHQYLSVLQKK
jgi:ubiquinone/menaquinone biosynthesis C-methylase UbiE